MAAEHHILSCKENHNIDFGGMGSSTEQGVDTLAEDLVRQREEVGLQSEKSVERTAYSRGVTLHCHGFVEVQSVLSTPHDPMRFDC
jgi:hypothetical protein